MPEAGATSRFAQSGKLEVALEPLRLSLSMMNATLSYRIALSNGTRESLRDIRIETDMIGAHASLSREEQLAGPSSDAITLNGVDSIEPGATQVASGEFRLPNAQITPVRRGDAAMFVPLLRLRITARGAEPQLRTFLLGLPPARPHAGLLPIRLDLGPRVYPELAQRAFA